MGLRLFYFLYNSSMLIIIICFITLFLSTHIFVYSLCLILNSLSLIMESLSLTMILIVIIFVFKYTFCAFITTFYDRWAIILFLLRCPKLVCLELFEKLKAFCSFHSILYSIMNCTVSISLINCFILLTILLL